MSGSHRSLPILRTNPPKEILYQGEDFCIERLHEMGYVNIYLPKTSNTLLQGQEQMLGLHTNSSIGLTARSADRVTMVYQTTFLHG